MEYTLEKCMVINTSSLELCLSKYLNSSYEIFLFEIEVLQLPLFEQGKSRNF